MVVTTKSQSKARATTPPEEEARTAKSFGTASSRERSSDSSSQVSSGDGWTLGEDGIYSGFGTHYGDTQPKVFMPSVAEALKMIQMIDPTAKLPKSKNNDVPMAPIEVPSRTDTINTWIVDVGGKTVVSGPLARLIASARGDVPLGAGEGNPVIPLGPPEGTPMAEAFDAGTESVPEQTDADRKRKAEERHQREKESAEIAVEAAKPGPDQGPGSGQEMKAKENKEKLE